MHLTTPPPPSLQHHPYSTHSKTTNPTPPLLQHHSTNTTPTPPPPTPLLQLPAPNLPTDKFGRWLIIRLEFGTAWLGR
ncbi:hypothetical protein Pmani_028984 [Petrolisthes manimaculis]|uniref:Uncharacterized protein n=1 Tax=Petrolisthes manimaculis TaxID=1843537 RepID=A0AAE1TV17_9EUCA|nr:hypothetical protein Pmani_028984 [Petrolisthes manimaculis]